MFFTSGCFSSITHGFGIFFFFLSVEFYYSLIKKTDIKHVSIYTLYFFFHFRVTSNSILFYNSLLYFRATSNSILFCSPFFYFREISNSIFFYSSFFYFRMTKNSISLYNSLFFFKVINNSICPYSWQLRVHSIFILIMANNIFFIGATNTVINLVTKYFR